MFFQRLSTTVKAYKHLQRIILFHILYFGITNQLLYKNFIVEFVQNVLCILFAVCRNICYSCFNSLLSCVVILKFFAEDFLDFKLCRTKFADFLGKLDIKFFAVVFFFIDSQLMFIQLYQQLDYSAASNLFSCVFLPNIRTSEERQKQRG